MRVLVKIVKVLSFLVAGFTGVLAVVFLVGYFGWLPSYKAYVVLSGSMEPTIKVGSLAIVIPFSNYEKGDIISFAKDGDKKNVVTHRIAAELYSTEVFNKPYYLTAGDANKQSDQGKVEEEEIIGKVIFALPKVGYFVDFVKKPYGFILFVIVPATIIVYEELKSLKREIIALFGKFQEREKGGKGLPKLAIVVPVIAAAMALTSLSISFFSDRETSSENSFVAGVWITPLPTIIPTLTPIPTATLTPTPILPKVVINEVYYDVAPGKGNEGNASNPDEWVELYNNTNSPINLKNWVLQDNSASDTISNSNVYISANGFAVLAKSASTWTYWTIPSSAEKISLGYKIGNGLANDGDRLILKDEKGTVVDMVSWGDDSYAFSPPATDVAEGHSLERNPDGFDTDTATDFIDQENPTPGS